MEDREVFVATTEEVGKYGQKSVGEVRREFFEEFDFYRGPLMHYLLAMVNNKYTTSSIHLEERVLTGEDYRQRVRKGEITLGKMIGFYLGSVIPGDESKVLAPPKVIIANPEGLLRIKGIANSFAYEVKDIRRKEEAAGLRR